MKWTNWYCWENPWVNNQQKETGLKILSPIQMLQRLPIALAILKTGNNSQKLLNEIWQIVDYLYQKTKKLLKTCTVT